MTVLAYSDGLVESRRQDLFTGIDVLRDVVADLAPRRRNPRELCARLSELMQANNAAEDDVTILAVTAAPDQTRAAQELPGDPSAARLARRFVSSSCATGASTTRSSGRPSCASPSWSPTR